MSENFDETVILTFLDNYSNNFDALEFIKIQVDNYIDKKGLIIKNKELSRLLLTKNFKIIKLKENEFKLKTTTVTAITYVKICNMENNLTCSIRYGYEGNKYLYLCSLYICLNDNCILNEYNFPAMCKSTIIKENIEKIKENIFASKNDLYEIVNHFSC